MTVAFDTLKFARALREKGGMSAEQAEGVAEAFSGATTEQLATKSDWSALGAELRGEMASVKAEVLVLKWMASFTIALVVAVLFLLLRR